MSPSRCSGRGSGKLSRRSIQIIRMVLRAALDDAVDVGELRRNPAARVGMQRNVAKTSRELDRTAWTEDELRKFLTAIADHRWAGPLRLAALYGLRRSELLGLSWSAVDARKGTVRIEQALIEVHGRLEAEDIAESLRYAALAVQERKLPLRQPV